MDNKFLNIIFYIKNSNDLKKYEKLNNFNEENFSLNHSKRVVHSAYNFKKKLFVVT
jgi:hypothetical protein